MFSKLIQWLGLQAAEHDAHGHGHGHGPLDHSHGVIDASIATTARGIWAIKWSFVILAATAAMQLAVVFVSGSVALLADTIHNIGDAGTAIPLWIAFLFARRKPTRTFTYGYGRVEDLAGLVIVLVILVSALVAGYEAIDRIINPRPVTNLGWLVAAGLLGFLGNEVVAVLRIKVGREINSAALIADGYHARTDGLTSLAVVMGALGVWAGFALADPIVGLIITVVILGIVWQSGKAVLTRMLDGVDPDMVGEIRHAAEHADGVVAVDSLRSRWLGHRLYAELKLVVDPAVTVADASKLAETIRAHAKDHLSALEQLSVEVVPALGQDVRGRPAKTAHLHSH